MRVRAREVATDGFMVNLFEMLMRFSEPFMDYKYSKVRAKTQCATQLAAADANDAVCRLTVSIQSTCGDKNGLMCLN